MPIGDPKPFADLVSALASDLNANRWIACIQDRSDNAFDHLGEGRYVVPKRASQMIFRRRCRRCDR
jgi:hypothetical protein